MRVRWMAMIAALMAMALLCGCVGYFHYHPVKSTEEERAKKAGAQIFPGEELGTPFAPGISGISVTEETMIEEEALIK